MSSHSILSKFVSGRSRDRQELLVVNWGSDVSMGEWEWSKMLEWLSRSFWRSSIKENDSLSSLPLVNWGISLPEGKVPSRRASSWFSRLIDKLVVGSKDTGGGAIWICGGGRDITVFTGIVVMLAVTGLILEMGDGSSFIGREISALTTVKQNKQQTRIQKRQWHVFRLTSTFFAHSLWRCAYNELQWSKTYIRLSVSDTLWTTKNVKFQSSAFNNTSIILSLITMLFLLPALILTSAPSWLTSTFDENIKKIIHLLAVCAGNLWYMRKVLFFFTQCYVPKLTEILASLNSSKVLTYDQG